MMTAAIRLAILVAMVLGRVPVVGVRPLNRIFELTGGRGVIFGVSS